MCSAGGRQSYVTHTGSSAMKITTGPLVPKDALQETTVLATSPASLMGKKPVCRDGGENTAKNVSKSEDTIWALFFVCIKGHESDFRKAACALVLNGAKNTGH